MRIRVLALAAVLFSSGCTVTMTAGVDGVEADKVPMEKSAGIPIPVAGDGQGTSKFGFNTFVLEKRDWNETITVRLKSELEKRGVDTTKGPEIKIDVTDYQYNELDVVVFVSSARLGIEVNVGNFRKRYTGDRSTASSSTNAVWNAAGHALSLMMADPEFRKAIKAN